MDGFIGKISYTLFSLFKLKQKGILVKYIYIYFTNVSEKVLPHSCAIFTLVELAFERARICYLHVNIG